MQFWASILPHHWEAKMAHLMVVEMAANNREKCFMRFAMCKQENKQALILKCLPHHLEALRAHHWEARMAINEKNMIRKQD